MTRQLRIHHLYKHFKDKLYYVIDEGIDSETLKPVVIYRAMYGKHKIFVRDKEMFLSLVDQNKYPGCTQTYRFEEVEQ